MALGKLPTSLLDDLCNIEYPDYGTISKEMSRTDVVTYRYGIDKTSELVRMYGICKEIFLTPEEILLIIEFLELHKRLSNKLSEVSNEAFH